MVKYEIRIQDESGRIEQVKSEAWKVGQILDDLFRMLTRLDPTGSYASQFRKWSIQKFGGSKIPR